MLVIAVVANIIFFSPTNHLTSWRPKQSKNRPHLNFQNVLIILLVGLHHAEGGTKEVG